MKLTVYEHEHFAPTCVSLYLTDACNLRCSYCYASGGSNLAPVRIPMQAAKAGIDYVAANAMQNGEDGFVVNFHGAGEPTLAWKELTLLVQYAKEKARNLGCRVSVTTCTNGVISEQHSHWLAENTDAAAVSLDGLPRDHDYLRPKPNGTGSFKDVARTLRIFDEMDMLYSLRATITESNVHTMAEMVDFLSDSFNPAELQFDPVLVAGRCHETGCRPAEEHVYAIEFMHACDMAEKKGCKLGFSVMTFTALRTFYCCSASDGFTITHDGNLTACFEACTPDHPAAKVFIYGRYDSESNQFVMDQKKLARLRRRHVNNLSLCKNCFCKYICAGDCPMNSLRLGRSLEEGGGRCALTQSIARYRLASMVASDDCLPPKRFDPEVGTDFSLEAYVGRGNGEPAVLLSLHRLRVHEVNYMKPPPPEQAARELISSANAAYRQQDFQKALWRYDKAIQVQPNNPDAHNNRGLCLHKLGRLKEASEEIGIAICENSKNPMYHLNLGKVLLTGGDLDGSIRAFDAALQLDPNLMKVRYNKAWALMDRGEISEAMAMLSYGEEASDCIPAAKVLAVLAKAYRCKSPDFTGLSYETTEDCSPYEWIIDLNRSLLSGGINEIHEDVRPLFSQALREFSVEQFYRARRYLDRVITQCPGSPLPHLVAAMCLQGEGKRSEADRELDLCVGLMAVLRLPSVGPLGEIAVDGKRLKTGLNQVRILPGQHVASIIDRTSGRTRTRFYKLTVASGEVVDIDG